MKFLVGALSAYISINLTEFLFPNQDNSWQFVAIWLPVIFLLHHIFIKDDAADDAWEELENNLR